MAYWKCKGEFKGYIDIYGEANANLTATTTGKSYTATADSSGYARITVKKKGDYTITSNRTIRSAYATIVNKTPVTAQYRWNKYQAPLVYAKANTYYEASNSGYPTWVYALVESGDFSGAVQRRATSYTFNTSNGKYTVSGGYSSTVTSGTAFSFLSTPDETHTYTTKPGNGSTSPVIYDVWRVQKYGTSGGSLEYNVSRSPHGIYISAYASTTGAYRWYSTSSYQRGDYIGVSSGANLTTYPTDARASDGYWYVAI